VRNSATVWGPAWAGALDDEDGAGGGEDDGANAFDHGGSPGGVVTIVSPAASMTWLGLCCGYNDSRVPTMLLAEPRRSHLPST